jgi:predicted dehydrogenase
MGFPHFLEALLIDALCFLWLSGVNKTALDMQSFNDKPLLPTRPRPICIVGAGSIVRDAHLPAYKLAGFPVHGITDLKHEAAEKLAAQSGISRAFESLDAMLADSPANAVFDLALPPNHFADVLRRLPEGSPVLLQKPMGETMEQADEILAICRERRFVAAVNFQLRFAPFVMAAESLIASGTIGDLRDMEIRVTAETPWDHFPFLKNAPRLELLYHSVHFIDCARHFLGNPSRIQAKTLRHPELDMPPSRSALILDYGDAVRANIQTNHFHRFGTRHQESFIKWEGTKGAIFAKMGLLMNYPLGVPDEFEVCTFQDGKPVWETIPLEGSWFPHAFIGAMAQVMRAADGDAKALVTPVEDSIHTMACLEAAYESSDNGGCDPSKFITP